MLSFERSLRYSGLWSLKWKGCAFFGNTHPFGFFFGFRERRWMICTFKGLGKRHIGVKFPNGSTKLL